MNTKIQTKMRPVQAKSYFHFSVINAFYCLSISPQSSIACAFATWRTSASIPWPIGCNDLGPSCKCARFLAPTDRQDSGRKAMSKCSKALSIWSKLATTDYAKCPSICYRCYWCSDDKFASWKRLSAVWTDSQSENEWWERIRHLDTDCPGVPWSLLANGTNRRQPDRRNTTRADRDQYLAALFESFSKPWPSTRNFTGGVNFYSLYHRSPANVDTCPRSKAGLPFV